MKNIIFYMCLLVLGDVSAQQSSKSKSKDRFRERSGNAYPVRITNAGDLNGDGADYAPAFYKDGIVFISAPASPDRQESGEGFAELHYAFFNSDGTPFFPQKVAFVPEKKPDFNDGPVCFSRDNKTVFLTVPNAAKTGKDGKTMLKICESRYVQSNWTIPAALPFNSDEFSCMHPSLSADGSRLFFSSDMPGGHGGYDLYMVERSGNGWGAPVNLGPGINTGKQEIFPFAATTGALFFSSNGRNNGLGGFDNFFVNDPLGKPEAVSNLGPEFNSKADDMSFILDAEGRSGFFTSSRTGGAGNVDIYRFEAPNGLAGANKVQSSLVPIAVSDVQTGKALHKAEIRIFPASENGFGSGEVMYQIDLKPLQDKVFRLDLALKNTPDPGDPDYFSNAEGKAQVELARFQRYRVVVSLPGYQPHEKYFSVDKEQAATLQFKLPASNGETAADSTTRSLQSGNTIILENIFTEANSATLHKSGELYLDALIDLLQQRPELTIDLSAHTDTRGDARLNQQLSDARARKAKDYLTGRGIAPQRIDAAGKGETEPRNRCKDGVQCSEEEHRANNRLEARVR